MSNTKPFIVTEHFINGKESDSTQIYPLSVLLESTKNFRLVEIGLERIVAFEVHTRIKDVPNTSAVYTVVPGFCREESPEKIKPRKITYEIIPEEQREQISETLRQQGYQGHIKYWNDYPKIE